MSRLVRPALALLTWGVAFTLMNLHFSRWPNAMSVVWWFVWVFAAATVTARFLLQPAYPLRAALNATAFCWAGGVLARCLWLTWSFTPSNMAAFLLFGVASHNIGLVAVAIQVLNIAIPAMVAGIIAFRLSPPIQQEQTTAVGMPI